MQFENLQTPAASYAPARNRVLRNTYMLLGLSMIPTVLGAMIGVRTGFSFFAGSPMIGFLAFLAIAFGFFYGIQRFKNSGVGVALLLGFTLFMGLMLSGILRYTLHFSNGAELIALAAGGTGAIFVTMAGIATVSKRDFSNLGKFLFAGMILVLLASLANIFLALPALTIAVSVLCVAIFSAYILYDVQQVVNGGETNYVIATLQIYLDVYNVFVHLLSLLGIFGGNRD
ncbi:Bax inhibitor-1/YccA family protein [Niveibacterium terrae]|uniref:Bax inhibitor-1/YccA family protein n=1 Tax=Niveibacterium terrae TaxID=3373598 RepID=UPI003A954B80